MFTEKYTLNKSYFAECFDESVPFSDKAKPKYPLLVFLILLSGIAWFLLKKPYAASFLVLVATLEVVAFIYRRPWWIARQMLSRASGSLVTLHIDEQGIRAVNPYKQYQFAWQDIEQAYKTDKGVVLKTKQGMQYISKALISPQSFDFILAQTKI
ncbi:YcxB family protein [Pseudoalteromonas sp. JBTF-M23]|uniref:YcxB family protein n=1 Tax=Pseudoalteromonas caenipelagi TaxID=2726988 RepID=A0A849VFZ1_9GAMM|nr:YcxB family protein [Pseudoalteromonas caenipelagi]NOU52342.1 YcxB family protein [Pseudoalteromonas caenipelagi]